MSDWYELIGQSPVKMEGDIVSKALRFESMERRVASTKVLGICLVSTVFLGLDHGWNSSGPAVLFETMAFWGEEGGYECERCSTWQEAEAQHATMCSAAARPPAVIAYIWRRLKDWKLQAGLDLSRRWRELCGVELTETEKLLGNMQNRIQEDW